MVTLRVAPREAGAGLGNLRAAGRVPAVVYGAHQESTPIVVEAGAFEKVLKDAGEATIVSLTGLGEDIPTLIHEIDVDPVTNRARHVDFYAVTKGEKVKIKIPLEFMGVSPAVEAGANLVKVLHEVEVEADPMKLPQYIEVDITVLAAVGDKIIAEALTLPAGVTLVTPAEEAVALAQEVVEEKVEETPADLSSIEVEKKGKEEGEAPPEGEAPKEEAT